MYLAFFNSLANKMVANVNMFSMCMELSVLSKCNYKLIIRKSDVVSSFLLKILKINEQSQRPF